MRIAVVSVWHQQEEFLTPRMEALLSAELETLKKLPSEDSHGGVHDGESKLVPRAGILSYLTFRECPVRG